MRCLMLHNFVARITVCLAQETNNLLQWLKSNFKDGRYQEDESLNKEASAAYIFSNAKKVEVNLSTLCLSSLYDGSKA